MILGVQDRWRAGEAAVGKYRIVSHLGHGGTADVYLAVADGPAGFRKLVVLKILKQSLSSEYTFRAMFLSEARLAARLSHPNIVQTNEVLELDGLPVIVMEYLDGQPLSQVIVRGRDCGFSLAMHLRVLIDALQGLHAAHELADFDGTPLGVVHRDVSPQNVFVTLDGLAKVLDFGIAKLERSAVDTDVGTIKGKLRYMAPEQIAAEKLTRRADIYAAGVMLWESLVGERMWKGCSEADIRSRVLGGDLPTAQLGDASLVLAHICRRALSLSPGDRQATALDLSDELEAALPGLGLQVSHRDIGALVGRLFESERTVTKSLLERESQKSVVFSTPLTEVTPSAPVAEKADSAQASGRHAPLRRSALFAAAGVALLSVAATYWVARRHSGGLASPAPAREVSALPPKAAPSESAPPRLPEQPALPQVPAAPAAADDARRIQPHSPGTGRPSTKRTQRPIAPLEAPPSGTRATDDCTHPFFFDASGIKRIRPECM